MMSLCRPSVSGRRPFKLTGRPFHLWGVVHVAWIESHQELGRHPKTRKLARLLGVTVPTAVGHLHFLWWWALDFAQDGDLTRYDPEEIAFGAMWEEDATQFLQALVNAGFLDFDEETNGYKLHDWDEYAGRLIERRNADAERKRKARETAKKRDSSGTSVPNVNDVADVRRTSAGHPQDVQRNLTVPNQTKPNLTVPVNHHHDGEPTLDDKSTNDDRVALICRLAEDCFGRIPNPLEIDKVLSYLDDGMEAEAVALAIKQAAERGKDLYYARRIMESWMQKGIKTKLAAEADMAAWKGAKKRGGNGSSAQKGDPERIAELGRWFEENSL